MSAKEACCTFQLSNETSREQKISLRKKTEQVLSEHLSQCIGVTSSDQPVRAYTVASERKPSNTFIVCTFRNLSLTAHQLRNLFQKIVSIIREVLGIECPIRLIDDTGILHPITVGARENLAVPT